MYVLNVVLYYMVFQEDVLSPYEIGKLAKSQKRPNRPFGGYLCPKCARKHFKTEARK